MGINRTSDFSTSEEFRLISQTSLREVELEETHVFEEEDHSKESQSIQNGNRNYQ